MVFPCTHTVQTSAATFLKPYHCRKQDKNLSGISTNRFGHLINLFQVDAELAFSHSSGHYEADDRRDTAKEISLMSL